MDEGLQEGRLDCRCRGQDVEAVLALGHPMLPETFCGGISVCGMGLLGACSLPSLNPSSHTFALGLVWCLMPLLCLLSMQDLAEGDE